MSNIVLDRGYSIAREERPRNQSMWDWYRSLQAPQVQQPTMAQSAVNGLVDNAIGASVGTITALIETDLGGLDLGGKYPIDVIAAFLLLALSIRDAAAPDGLADKARTASSNFTTVFFNRKAKAWRESNKVGIPRNVMATGEDPIVAASKGLF